VLQCNEVMDEQQLQFNNLFSFWCPLRVNVDFDRGHLYVTDVDWEDGTITDKQVSVFTLSQLPDYNDRQDGRHRFTNDQY